MLAHHRRHLEEVDHLAGGVVAVGPGIELGAAALAVAWGRWSTISSGARTVGPCTLSQLPLRQGRAIGWIEEALAPLQPDLSALVVHRLAIAIRATTGIEALAWLTDVAGLSREDAVDLMRWSARSLLGAALADPAARPLADRP